MTEIQFNEPLPVAPVRTERQTLLSALVIKTGLAKDLAGAQKVLLILALIAFGATAAVLFVGNSTQGPTPQELEAEILRG